MWPLILFLTLGMPGHIATTATVTHVDRGVVTMQAVEEDYKIPEAEAWRVGDQAECVIGKHGILDARYVWK